MVGESVSFEPTRLTLARHRRRLTKAKLAKRIGVSLRMVSSYEAGTKAPAADTLAVIARELGFPDGFFAREPIELPSPLSASFRSLAAMKASERDAALAAGGLACEFAMWINGKFNLPSPTLPDFRNVKPETAAELLRVQWSLDEKPIPNAVHLLEAHGIRVFSMAEPGNNVDAFSLWRDGLPFIFLNTQKSAERSRHNAIHELGHLVMHQHGAPTGQQAEREADTFASAFLLPRTAVERAATRYPTLESLIPVKQYWKVSLANLVYRLYQLQLLTDWHYRLLFMEMGERGYRNAEPDSIPRETSQVLEKVFAHLRKQEMSKAQIAHELHIPFEELEALVFGLVVSAVKGNGGFVTPSRTQVAPRLSIV